MKTLRHISLVLLCIASFSNAFSKDAPYDFPVRPEGVEWAKLRSYQDKVDACNIAEDVASKMSTRSLFKTCMDYPLRVNYIAHSGSPYDGVLLTMNRFNGFKELLTRNDMHIYLLDEYLDYSVSKALKLETHFDFMDYEILNLLLLKDEILGKYNTAQLNKLLTKALLNTKQMRAKEGLAAEALSSRLACKIIYFSEISGSIKYKPLVFSMLNTKEFFAFIKYELILEKEYMDQIYNYSLLESN